MCTSQMRGDVKYKAHNLVAILYGLEDLKSKPNGKTLICREVEHLLDCQAFLYQVSSLSFLIPTISIHYFYQ